MLCKTFKLNFLDFTEHVHENGLTIIRTPISALPEKYTMDGKLHDDVIKKKATYILNFNPVPPEVGQSLLREYDDAHVFITIFDLKKGADITIECKTGMSTVSPEIIEQGEYTYWKINDLTFQEL